MNLYTKEISFDETFHAGRLQKILIEIFGYMKYIKSTCLFPNVNIEIRKQSQQLSDLRYKQGVLSAIRKEIFIQLQY